MRLASAAAFSLLGLAATASAPLATALAETKPQECFRSDDWQGTTAAGPHDLYLRVGVREVWHIGMAQECPGAIVPGRVQIEDLVTGSNHLICSPNDVQIAVAPAGFSHSIPCSISELHHLTHLEAEALPRNFKP